jgi:hypothetical protein
MPAEPIQRRKLYQEVLDRLMERIGSVDYFERLRSGK